MTPAPGFASPVAPGITGAASRASEIPLARTATAGLIRIKDVRKTYQRGRVVVPALERVTMSIEPGEFLAIMGSSGCGKTTLLNLIGALDRPSSGEIWVADVPIGRLDHHDLARWRQHSVGFVFQFYNLLPFLTAAQNVELPLLLSKFSSKERRERVDALLGLVDMRHRHDHRPDQLSGGQQQRVAIARALITSPAILVCDEPTGDLDRESSTQIMEILSMLHREHGKTVIVATHDAATSGYAKRVVVLPKSGVFSDASAAFP